MAVNVQVEVPIVQDFVNDGPSDKEDRVQAQTDNPGGHAEAAALEPASVKDSQSQGGSGVTADAISEAEAGEEKVANGSERVRKATIDDFNVIAMIGKGGYGKVYLVQHKETQRHYAMKVLRKASILLHKRQITFTMTERSILSEVQHPFIVKLYYAFQSNSKLYLIMEYVAGGELFTHMARERIFTEDQAVFYMAELVLALSHLHKLGIVFRDIKPENCLLNNKGHLVLTDFGLSKTALGEDGRTSTFCGTPSYMAPEILDASVSYDFSVDWWSLGILLYEMLTGGVPFKGRTPDKISKNIAKMKVNYPNYLTPDAKDLIIRLLRKKPSQRLGYGPDGAKMIKKHRFFRGVDWDDLAANYETITPPIVPKVGDDGDFSNFDTEFTSEQLPPSVVHGSLVDLDPIVDPSLPSSRSGDGEENEGDIDPSTAFLGFSYVATSVLHRVE
ncbi:Pkinase-domain-containing protein [Martensiomyces pterosporus]|nr:Pkinase-domain-containing protein [Martensiomyces pterosporus]